jgi:pimeloyl-[acyl-carrier protein] methyl ester esterase
MSLHVDSYGSGAPLLLIHGWGMHGGMWSGVAEQLARHFRVHAVDLPGHGFSAVSGQWPVVSKDQDALLTTDHLPLTNQHSLLDAIVDELAAQFAGPLNVCGWSLGGQIALRWAQRQPQQVSRLVMVASTPCFVRRTDWTCAMAAETLAEFAAALQQNYAQILRRFLALQVRGSEQERELLVALRGALFSRGEPDLAALQSGLEILRDCDLRSALPEVNQATLVIAGERDTLTPPQAAQYLAGRLSNAQLALIKGAAHAPFLSHPEEFMEHLIGFLHE